MWEMSKIMRIRRQALGFFLCLTGQGAFGTDYVVTSASVFETGNLDQVLQQASAAPGPHTITFDPAILPATFTISIFGRQTINYDLTMTGPGADQVTIDFGGFNPGFAISAGRTVVFSGIKFANARVVGSSGANGSFSTLPTAGGPGEGGAIHNAGNLTVTNCVFESCKARGGEGGSGAQFTNQQGQPAGAGRGGAIYSNGTSLTVTGCLFTGNDATGGSGGSGARNTEGFEFSYGGRGGDAGAGRGGAIYVAAGTTSITRSTFSGQTANGGFGGAGGQFLNTGGSGTNPGGAGANAEGAAVYAASSLSLTHCTIAHGICRSGGGGSSGPGLSAAPGVPGGSGVFGAGTVTIGNTLVATNRVAVGFNILTNADVAGAFASQGYNLIGALPGGVAGFAGATELTGTVALALDPRIPFSPAPNGFAVGSLRLLPGSPAVDQGKALGGTTVDQRGLARTVNLADGDFPNSVGGDGTDIGAFESQTLPNSQPGAFSGNFFTVTAGQALSGISVFVFDEDGDPLTLSIVGTALPAGLTLNNDGTITGTTTVAGSGIYQFKANDGKEDSEVASFTLFVNEAPSLVVNTLADAVSNIDGVTSLREAVTLAQTDGQTTPVTFDPVFFAKPKSTAIPFSPISITNDVEIIGPAAGVSLSSLTLSISSGTVALSNLTFRGQMSAPYIDVSGTTLLTATGCTFGDGQFFSSSLPVVNNGGTVTLRNCTVAGNDVTNSGSTASALYLVTGTLLLENCTVAANIGQNAIEIIGGTFSMGNTLVAGNTIAAGGAAANQIKGAVTSLGYNLIGPAPTMTLTGVTTGNQLNVANPLLDPDGLSSNGGPTRTIALVIGSPAIDKGKLLGGVTTDQRGRARPFDNTTVANATGGDGSDIGAFELISTDPLLSLRQITDISTNTFGPEFLSGDSFNFTSFFTAEVGFEIPITFSLRNKGTAPLLLNGAPSITGTGAASFVLEEYSVSTFVAGASTTFKITFWPQTVGPKTATLTIPSNDPDKPNFTLQLSGTAQSTFPVAPTLITPQQGTSIPAIANITFKLQAPPVAGTVQVRFQLQGPPFTGYDFDLPDIVTSGIHTTTLDTVTKGMNPGVYFVFLTYQDAAGFTPQISTQDITLRPSAAFTTLRLASKGPAPGAGALLPAGATMTSFNLPAIDDAGNITYVAKWANVTPKASGTGLFLNNSCLAIVGGLSPISGGSKYTAFTDPVIDGGQIVSIASLSGGTPKPPAKVVVMAFTSQPKSPLTIVAALGQAVPDANGQTPVGGPVFSAFTAVDVHARVIGIFAKVSGGTGLLKKTAANDVGLWIKNGSNPMVQALREGQTIGTKTVSTLVSFTAGALSGGQGRGWVTKPTGTGGAVLALVTFTDKTQAVVSAEAGGVTTVFSSAGALNTQGGPSLADASFATYGFPSANDADTSTFLASLKVGAAGVVAANARGLFLSNPDGSYATLARVGQPSGILGSNFSVLRDPVLSSNSGVAFLATLKGGTATGLLTTTLWWKPFGETLRVFAQGGTEAAGVPGSQWKSFTTMAIAGGNRGPVFAASLVAVKGGVTSATDTGVWGCDYNGNPSLLFREGDTIAGKRLTAFNLLKSTSGNLGVTRSLNDTQRVVWIATFSDKSTALMTTETP
jgi:hypothetical protein